MTSDTSAVRGDTREGRDQGYPAGPDWRMRLERGPTGRRRYYMAPPNLVERFWPWPVGIAAVFVLSLLDPPTPPLVYFLVGAGIVATWTRMTYEFARQEHIAAVHRWLQDLGDDPEFDGSSSGPVER